MEHAGTLMGIAILYDTMQQNKLAFEYIEQCMEAFNQTSFRDQSDHANGLKYRGKFLRKLGRRPEALSSFVHAMELFEKLGQTQNQWYFDAAANLATEYLYSEEFEKAFVLLRRSEKGFQALGMTTDPMYKEVIQTKTTWQQAALASRHHASLESLQSLIGTLLRQDLS